MNKVSPAHSPSSPVNFSLSTASDDEIELEIEYEYTYEDYEQDVADGQLMEEEWR